jgi:hypothetical protein
MLVAALEVYPSSHGNSWSGFRGYCVERRKKKAEEEE